MLRFLMVVIVLAIGAGVAVGITKFGGREDAAKTENLAEIREVTEAAPEPKPTAAVESVKLEIINPTSGMVVESPRVMIEGTVDPGTEVFVDDKQVTVEKSGAFGYNLVLDEGENEYVITANDEEGNMTEKTVKVTYEPAN